MKNYSLIQYPGGKTRAVDILSKYIPKNTKEICSPFFGGGSFEIYMSKNGIGIHGYDVFRPLVCFWNAVLKDRDRLIEIVERNHPLEKNDFYNLQKQISQMSDETEIGATFFILNRSSFSGTGLSGGMSPGHKRFTKSAIERIRKFDAIFSIEELSFEQSITRHDCLVYADPPYLISPKIYGVNGSTHKNFDHVGLSEILNNRGNFILSYNKCDEILDMYRNHNIFYPEWTYGMGKDKRSYEVLIVSRDIKL
jgi:DNA adenine methylase